MAKKCERVRSDPDLESPCTGPRQQIDLQLSAIVSLLWILVCKEWQVDSKPQQCGVWLMPLRVIHLAKQGSSLSLAVLKRCHHLILATSDLNWAENCQIRLVIFSTTLKQLKSKFLVAGLNLVRRNNFLRQQSCWSATKLVCWLAVSSRSKLPKDGPFGAEPTEVKNLQTRVRIPASLGKPS